MGRRRGGAVDHLDEVEALLLEGRADVLRGGGRVVKFDRQLAHADRVAVHQRSDGMPARSGEHAARCEDPWPDELARALGRLGGDHPLRVVTRADHGRDPAAQVGAPIEQQLLGGQLLR